MNASNSQPQFPRTTPCWRRGFKHDTIAMQRRRIAGVQKNGIGLMWMRNAGPGAAAAEFAFAVRGPIGGRSAIISLEQWGAAEPAINLCLCGRAVHYWSFAPKAWKRCISGHRPSTGEGNMRNRGLLALWAAALFASATAVRAATEITGPHNNQLDGYDATSGSYDVPADSGGVPSATFNNNGNDGLTVGGSGTSVTIEGGQFEGNFNFGVDIGAGGAVTVGGGVFDNNTASVSTQDSSAVLTILGGQFLDSENSIFDLEGEAAIYGGQFTSAYAFDVNYGTMDIYGAFAGVADGQTVTLPQDGIGTFYGELEDNSSAQTYQYVVGSGTINLHGTGTLIPEPATFSLIGLAGVALLVRHRCTAIAAVRQNRF